VECDCYHQTKVLKQLTGKTDTCDMAIITPHHMKLSQQAAPMPPLYVQLK